MSGVGADVSSFVVTVNGKVASDGFLDFESFVAKHFSEVSCPIEFLIWVDEFSFL